MKNTIKAKGPITKPLLAGLEIPTITLPLTPRIEAQLPSSGKTNQNQADFVHDPGNGFNPDSTFIQD